MSRIHIARLAVITPVILPLVNGDPIVDAQDQAPPCPEYVIEGTIGSVAPQGSDSPRMASVYVHSTGEPATNRQVIATFSDSSGGSIGEPVVLVTDVAGRAEVNVPDTAESVNFVSEAPDAPGCVGEDGSDPRVLLEIVPAGAPSPDSIGVPEDSRPEEDLARTGPVTDVIALASLLLLAFGASVGTGRGRRRSLARAQGGVKSRFPR